MTNANRHRMLAFSLAAVVTIGLSACGNGSNDSSTPAASTPAVGQEGGLTVVEDGLDAGTAENLNAAATEALDRMTMGYVSKVLLQPLPQV